MPSYPNAIPVLVNPTGSESMAGTNLHSVQHANANDEIEAIATELGTTPKGSWSNVGNRLEVLNAMNKAGMIHGGGVLKVSSSYEVFWSRRFMLIPFQRSSTFAVSGYFDIGMPANGTVITGVGGATNTTVTASGIPLGAWQAIYYILPLGGGPGTVTANFRIVQYTSDFIVPEHWVMVAVRNGDNTGDVTGPDLIWFCNGVSKSPWVIPGLANGWVSYPDPRWAFGGYMKQNNTVYMKGLIQNGATAGGTAIWTMPVGFRPSRSTHSIVSTSSNWAIINVYDDTGVVYCNTNVSASWLSMDSVVYEVGN